MSRARWPYGLGVLGLVLLVLASTTLLAQRAAYGRRAVTSLVVVAVLLVVVGAVAFPLGGAAERGEGTVAIGKASQGQPRHYSLPSTVWTTGQAVAALVVTGGVLAGAAAFGLRAGRRLSAPGRGRRTGS